MFPGPLFKPLRNEKKIFQQISDQIRELIFSGILKPGDKLPSENELSSQFSTGRMVVREALRTLEQSGLISVKRGSLGGAFVKNPGATAITRSISDLVQIGDVTHRELTEARLGVEMVVLESVIKKITAEDLSQLKQNIEDSERQILAGQRGTQDNLNFHVLLARSSKNLLYEMIVKSFMTVNEFFIQSLRPEVRYVKRILESHKGIYEAICEKDLQEAKEKMEKHIIDVNRKHMAVAKKIRNGS